NSDIATLVKPNSLWAKSADSADAVASLTAEAVAASFGPPGGPVSLILPADSAWLPTTTDPVIAQKPVRPAPAGSAVEAGGQGDQGGQEPSGADRRPGLFGGRGARGRPAAGRRRHRLCRHLHRAHPAWRRRLRAQAHAVLRRDGAFRTRGRRPDGVRRHDH